MKPDMPVIGHVLGLVCGSVTVVPDAVGFGCETTKNPLVTWVYPE
jgi:hypothetical protein